MEQYFTTDRTEPRHRELVKIDGFELLPIHAARLEDVRRKRNRPRLTAYLDFL